ncbi:MAG TPA: AAA family ATPase [Sedimentibacter sp.]|nr:AAA family ATPase [Sedimentibacter sp.]
MNVVLTGSQKNNIGKTIIGIKLSLELARSGKKVLMADLSAGKIKMAEYLNVNEDIIYDSVDVLKKTCTLEQGIIEINENLSLLPSPRAAGKINELDRESFKSLLDSIEGYDYVIIDADKLTSSYVDLSKVNNAISINSNDFSCIREINSDKTISSKAGNFVLVINKYNRKSAKKGLMMKPGDIERLTETPASSIIEENPGYLNMKHEMLLDSSFLKAEIGGIIKNLR